MASHNYIDEFLGLSVQLSLWRSFSMLLSLIVLVLSYVVIRQSSLIEASSNRQQVILSPAISRFEIASVGRVPRHYIKSAFEFIAHKNSSWTYSSIEENYLELFKHYYSYELETKIRANLEVSNRYAYVKKNQMISLFEVDQSKSKYEWCEAKNMACGIVTGKETLYISHNKPFRSKNVTYLFLAKMIYPTKTNPFSLKITRVVVGEYNVLNKALEAAKKGVLPDEIKISSH